MDKKVVLGIWLGLSLHERMMLFGQGKIMGLESFSVQELFPEKRLVEDWLVKI